MKPRQRRIATKKGYRKPQKCSRCGGVSHNIKTCKVFQTFFS